MTEVMLKQSKATSAALTKARLEAVLHETQRDEAKLRKILQMRRLKRRLRVNKAKAKAK